jgi:hypothetical protein
LTLAVSVGAIIYAHENHLSERRVQMLGQSCGLIMSVLLAVAVLTVFLIADRRKSD